MAKSNICTSKAHKTCGRNGSRRFSDNGAAWHAANNGGVFAKPDPKATKAKRAAKANAKARKSAVADKAKADAALQGMKRAAEVASQVLPPHTIGGKAIGADNPGEYGRTHDGDCPACVASGASFTASPRSETYWAS